MRRQAAWWRCAVWAVSVCGLLGVGCESSPPAVDAPARSVRASKAKPAPRGSGPKVLGEAPLCEPSAALRAPWDKGLVLVADNEQRKRLFTFRLKNGQLDDMGRLKVPKDDDPDDVEALVAVGKQVMIVGSHSRNKDCERRGKRQRIKLVSWSQDNAKLRLVRRIDVADTWRDAMKTTASCLASRFTTPAPKGAEAVCAALVKAEREGTEERCETINIEGAFATRDGRVWLGLRAPTVEGDAVLVRMTEALDALRFDAVVRLDLGGDGVRELARRGATLWGIQGPTLDSDRAFGLWRIEADALKPGARVTPQRAAELPTSSEGLAFDGRHALVLIDGAEGDSDAACATPARWLRVKLPE